MIFAKGAGQRLKFLSRFKSTQISLSGFSPELQVGTRQKELLDIDSSSVILEDGITKLNTIGHYEVRTGLSPTSPSSSPSPTA